MTLTKLMPKVRGGAVFSAFLVDTEARGLSTGVTAEIRFMTDSGAQKFLDYAATSELTEELGGASVSLSTTCTHVGTKALYRSKPPFDDRSAKPTTRHLKLTGMDSVNLEELLNVVDEISNNTRGELFYYYMNSRRGAVDHIDIPFHNGVDSPLCNLLQDVWIDRRGVTHVLCASICTANWIWKLLHDFDVDHISYARDPCDDATDPNDTANDTPPPVRLAWGPYNGFLARFRKSPPPASSESSDTSVLADEEDNSDMVCEYESTQGRNGRIMNKPFAEITFDEMSCLPLEMRLDLEALGARQVHADDGTSLKAISASSDQVQDSALPHEPVTSTKALPDDAVIEMLEDLITFEPEDLITFDD